MSTPSSASTPSSHDPVDKMAKKSKIVTFKLQGEHLKKYAPKKADPPPRKNSKPKSASSESTSTPAMPGPSPSSGDNASEPNSTPAPPAATAPAAPTEPTKRKGIPGPKPGHKRGLGQGVEAAPKPRGKPGPKKKPRLEDGTIDPSHKTAAAPATHKLGPKANQGAINAGLRALDRSGKPCRKWERKAFQVKSFTGVVWQLPTWRAPKKDASAENKGPAASTGDSDSKANDSSNAVKSDKSNSGESSELAIAGNGTSSPVPIALDTTAALSAHG